MMKEPEPPLRLYDFLAYVFPGAVTLHALFLLLRDKNPRIIESLSTDYPTIDLALLVVASYLIGLIWSVISRDPLRSIIWHFDNPRIDFFEGTYLSKSPFTSELTQQLKEKTNDLFGKLDLKAEQGHRLCRAYVAHNCPTSWTRRSEIIAVRSMCANSIGPVLLYSIVFFSNGWRLWGVITCLGSVALLLKTITLDRREWKEIYTVFLVHQNSQKNVNNKEVNNQ